MRVGIVNSNISVSNSINYRYQQKPNIASQVSFCQINPINEIRNLLKKNKINTKKLEEFLGQIFEFNKPILEDSIIEEQKNILKELLELEKEINAKGMYPESVMFKDIIPFIKEKGNKGLADYILEITKLTDRDLNPENNNIFNSLENRIRFIDALGSTKNIPELESYTGKRTRLPESLRGSMGAMEISGYINNTIKKLSTNPPF